LTPAKGRQNHTTSPYASAPFVKGAARVHRIPPRVRDDREPPLRGTGPSRFSADFTPPSSQISEIQKLSARDWRSEQIKAAACEHIFDFCSRLQNVPQPVFDGRWHSEHPDQIAGDPFDNAWFQQVPH
jgi:hypothetical protein